jgi:MFS-type transporter involved in bile tolerance (Atg22 family)
MGWGRSVGIFSACLLFTVFFPILLMSAMKVPMNMTPGEYFGITILLGAFIGGVAAYVDQYGVGDMPT